MAVRRRETQMTPGDRPWLMRGAPIRIRLIFPAGLLVMIMLDLFGPSLPLALKFGGGMVFGSILTACRKGALRRWTDAL